MPYRHQRVGINQIGIDANIFMVPVDVVVCLVLLNYNYQWSENIKLCH